MGEINQASTPEDEMDTKPSYNVNLMSVDMFIFGAGSAGLLLPNRLSASPSHRVLLLVAGG